jgi:hypothetical protein
VKKLFFLILLFITLNFNIAKSDEMISIEKYLSDKDPKDYNATIYSLIRCSGLNVFLSAVADSKNQKELSNKLSDIGFEFASRAVQFDKILSKRNFDESREKMTEATVNISKLYKIDGMKNWIKNGSYYLGSYLDQDRKFCDDTYKKFVTKK